MRQFLRRTASVTFVALLSFSSATKLQAEESAPAHIPGPLLLWLSPKHGKDDLANLLAYFINQHDIEGDGLDADDIVKAREMAISDRQADQLKSIFSYDLDGDGVIGTNEAMRAARIKAGTDATTAFRHLSGGLTYSSFYSVMKYDRNQDGRVEFSEFIWREQSVRAGNGYFRDGTLSQAEALVALDPNADGKLTIVEIESLSRAAFDVVDRDRDATLTEAELVPYGSAIDQAKIDQLVLPCALPKAKPDTSLIFVAVEGGSQQPDVTTSGQYGLTTLADVNIQPGPEGIELVMGSTIPTIWRFSGAADRILRVTIIPPLRINRDIGEHSGVTGVSADAVTFLPSGSCGVAVHYLHQDPETALPFKENLTKILGRKPDTWISAGERSHLELPADRSEPKAATSFDVVSIDPTIVLSPNGAEKYRVLPRQFGLDQLVSDGKIERAGNSYRILQSIDQFPAGLEHGGEKRTRFILPSHVTLPTGLWDYPSIDPEP